MTDEEFAEGVDAILVRHSRGHGAHRALDMLWTHYTQELPEGNPVRVATAKWMQMIEGDHQDANPYPLPSLSWWSRPLSCKLGRHDWVVERVEGWGVWSADCLRCGAQNGSGSPCP